MDEEHHRAKDYFGQLAGWARRKATPRVTRASPSRRPILWSVLEMLGTPAFDPVSFAIMGFGILLVSALTFVF
jgi:hypothetical protein